MAGPIPRKITFTNTMGSGSYQPSLPAQDEPASSGAIQPRLIAPSEIQELGQLPLNMFVTSVDVESELWNEHPPSSNKKGKKKKASKGGRATSNWHDSSQMEDITPEVNENGQYDDADDGSLTLPYFDTDVQTTISAGITSRPFDWDRAERLWEDYGVVEKLEQLVVGCWVGQKVLFFF